MNKYQVDIKNLIYYDRNIGAIVKDTGYLLMPGASFSPECDFVYCDKNLVCEIFEDELKTILENNKIWEDRFCK